eukprot:scaffold1665_cov270-Alexandrium_tamarense.AAC.2
MANGHGLSLERRGRFRPLISCGQGPGQGRTRPFALQSLPALCDKSVSKKHDSMFFPKLQLTIAAIVACCAIQSSSAQDQTVVDIAVGNPDFSTLVAAVTAADLVETLSGEGPFTVLAPTNEAFDNLPEGTLDALLADIPALTEILMLHVISGTVLAEDVTSGPVETLGGEVEAVVSADGVVSFNGASVTAADIMASNGVIHVLDSVILPASAETEPTMTVDPVCQSIVEIATGNPDFSTLVAAVTAADLVETLSGDGPFTVLAPTNEAFDNLPEGTLDALLADIPALTEILMLHVISGTVLAEDVTSGPVETLGGEVEAVVSADGVTIGDAGVTATDIMACNGVIHVLDSVILPAPAETEPTMAVDPVNQSIVEIAAGNPDFSTLVAAVTAADLVETLSGDGPFTVLAPTNEAFDNLPEGTLDALLADIPALTEILMLHVISGTVLAEDVTSGPVETLGGEVEAVSIVEIGAGNPDFSTLVAAVTAADLVETLSGDGPFTVLAPTNEAFDNLPEGTLDALLADIPALTEILMLHVISGTVLAEDVTSGPVETLGGEVEAVVSADGVTIGDAGVTATDIMACNGVIHVLDSVIVAPSSAPTPVPTEMPESSATAYGTGMAAAAISVGFTMLI